MSCNVTYIISQVLSHVMLYHMLSHMSCQMSHCISHVLSHVMSYLAMLCHLSAPFEGGVSKFWWKEQSHTTWLTQPYSSSGKPGPRAILDKTDVKHAYKLVPIHPEDIQALGIRWFQHWLPMDATLPMGSQSGYAIFETFPEALQYLAQWKGCGDMCHVLDDFLMVSRTDETADERLRTFLGLCGHLGCQ